MSHLTAQRFRELSSATRRFVYTTKLNIAETFSNNDEFTRKVQACLGSLEKETVLRPSVLADVEGVLAECQQNCSSLWDRVTKVIDISILDARPEQVRMLYMIPYCRFLVAFVSKTVNELQQIS